MSTVGDVVDRALREFLYAADDQPTIARLAASASAGAATWALDLSGFAPEDEALLAPGVIVEAGLELARVVAVDGATATVQRAALGTDAQAHDAGAEVTLAPPVQRRAVFDAVADNVVALHPDLWRMRSTTITFDAAVVDAPADMIAVDRVRLTDPSGAPFDVGFDWLGDWPGSASGRALRLTCGSGPAVVSYRARFPRPTSQAEEMAELGVEPEWERIVVLGAVAQVIAGRDVDPATMHFVTEQLRAEQHPVGSAARVRDSLLRLHAVLLDRASRSLHDLYPPRVHMAPVGGSW